MDQGYHNPAATMTSPDDEPLFRPPPEEQAPRSTPGLQGLQIPQPGAPQHPVASTFGAPPMGEPSEPSAHPDNITAATQTPASVTRAATPPGAASSRIGGLGRQPSGSFGKTTAGPTGGLGRQPSGSFDKAAAFGSGMGAGGGGGGGLRRQASGAYDAAAASKTDKGFFSGTNAAAAGTTPMASPGGQPGVVPPHGVQRQESQPGLVPPQSGSAPVGAAPTGPYMKTEEVPPAGTSPMNAVVENFNKYRSKAEGLAGSIWGHMKTGPSVADAARGRVSQGIKMVQEGGFEGLYKSTFGPMAEGEQLRKTYACYLSTSTGPVAGTLYISNLKFSFSSDRPLAYKADSGLQAWSYYKMVVPLRDTKDVLSSFNESKPLEKYIQVVTTDGHDFWFMGFVNYDKGVKNMQLALQHVGEIDPNGGLKAPWAGMSVPGMKKPLTPGSTTPAAAAHPTTGSANPTTGNANPAV